MTTTPVYQSIDARARIGHVHLRVSNLERSIAFYRQVLGFDLVQYYGRGAAFLSAGGYHHHIGLNTWESLGGQRPPAGSTGLYHLAILYPDRPSLARAVKQVLEHGVQLQGASDHGVSEAIYFEDPDGNGIEIYRDRPMEEWPRDANGDVAMTAGALDLQKLLSEA